MGFQQSKMGFLGLTKGRYTIDLIGPCHNISSSPVTVRRRPFDSPMLLPLKNLQSHFMKQDLLSLCDPVACPGWKMN